MLYFFGVKGVIRSYRSAQELKADTLPAHALGDFALNGQQTTDVSLPLGGVGGGLEGTITFGFNYFNSSNSFNSKEVEQLAKLELPLNHLPFTIWAFSF